MGDDLAPPAAGPARSVRRSRWSRRWVPTDGHGVETRQRTGRRRRRGGRRAGAAGREATDPKHRDTAGETGLEQRARRSKEGPDDGSGVSSISGRDDIDPPS